MTVRISTMAGVALAALLAMPAIAGAQVTTRDHRKKRPATPIQASGFSPASGPVGTTVVIRGHGFDPDTRVIFGNTEVRPDKVTPRELRVRVPRAFGDGTIVLRQPGVGHDITVGQFAVQLPLAVTGFAPASGVPGTRLVIRGSGFHRGVAVTVGGSALSIVRMSPTRIVAVIPPGAATGPIAVSAGTTSARAPRRFQVLSLAPVITGFAPDHGPPGTRVTIRGQNFGAQASARYGHQPMQVIARTADSVVVTIPTEADGRDYLYVSTTGGEARAPSRFHLDPVPLIERFTPRRGIAGSRVDIIGSDFRAGDQFTLDGRRMRILQLRPRRVSVVIPRGARTAPIVVERRGYRATSTKSFEVIQPPAIVAFQPMKGPPGTRVTVTGSDFGPNAELYYGKDRMHAARGRADGRDQLAFAVPADATDQYITVRTAGGEDRTDQPFHVQNYPSVTTLTPARAVSGSPVEIRGDHLDRVDQVLVGRQQLRVVVRDRHHLAAVIPAGTRSGPVSLVAFGQTFDPRRRLDVFEPPRIRSIEPHVGVPGTEVVITGRNLTADTRFSLAGVALPVLRRDSDRIVTVLIPRNARGAAQIVATNGNVRAASRQTFTMLPPPQLRSITPHAAQPGARVTVRGRNLPPVIEVVWNGRILPLVSRQRDRQIVLRIPDHTPPGKGRLILRTHGIGIARSRVDLVVQPPAPKVKVKDHRKHH